MHVDVKLLLSCGAVTRRRKRGLPEASARSPAPLTCREEGGRQGSRVGAYTPCCPSGGIKRGHMAGAHLRACDIEVLYERELCGVRGGPRREAR